MFDYNKPIFDNARISYWHGQGYSGKGIGIAVLDTKHKTYDFQDAIEPIQPLFDTYGHSTGVIGVLREVCPSATIYNLPYVADGKTKQASLEWLIANKDKIDLINCSFSSPFTTIDFPKIKDLGIPIISASGNDGKEDQIRLPARFDYTIAVGAWMHSTDSSPKYSNAGPELDLVAYTNVMYKTDWGGTTFSGTSGAAPVATGMLALYLEWRKKNKLRELDPEEIRDFVQSNTIDKYDEGHDYKSGYGLFILPNQLPIIKESDYMVFKDTKEHWAKDFIDFVSDKGLMKGYEDGTFKPDAPMTRAEVATVLARIQGFEKK